MSHLRHRALVRGVTDALTACLNGDPEPEKHLAALFTGRRPLEDALLANGALMGVIRRVTGRPPDGAVLMPVFGQVDREDGSVSVLEPERADPVAVTWGRMLAAFLVDDAAAFTALWEAHVQGDLERARAAVHFSLRATANVVDSVPCTCGECPGAQDGRQR